MIIGIGTDIAKISRIRDSVTKYGEQFLKRCFTDSERNYADRRHEPITAYTRMFAVKEAVLKAFGTGMREGLSWHDMEIYRNELGAPSVRIGDGAKRYLPDTALNIRLSMSDDGDYAVAFVIIEKIDEQTR